MSRSDVAKDAKQIEGTPGVGETRRNRLKWAWRREKERESRFNDNKPGMKLVARWTEFREMRKT